MTGLSSSRERHVLRVCHALTAELDLDRLVQLITDEATALSGAAMGAFFYNSTDGGDQYRLCALAGADREAFAGLGNPRATALFGPTFAGRGTVRVDDVTKDPRYGQLGPHHGFPRGHPLLASYLAVPVVSPTGEVYGGLFLGHPQPAVFDAADEEAVVAVAAQAAIAIQNARLFHQLQAAERLHTRRARHAALAIDIGTALTQQEQLRPMLQRCCVAICEHLDAAFTRVWVTDASRQVLELQASAGLYTHTDGAHARVPVGSFKIGLVAAEKKPHLTNDVMNDEQVSDPAWARREGMTSFAAYPLLDGDDVVGVLGLFGREPLPPDTLDALGAVADSLGLGIVRLRANEERTLRTRQLRALNDAVLAINSATSVDETLQVIAERARHVVGARRATLRVIDQAGEGTIDVSSVAEGREDAGGQRGGATAGSEDLSVPLVARDGRSIGIIHLVDKEGGGFTAADREIVTQLSQLAAVAIENVRLIGALERSNKELDQFAYVASHDLKAPLRGISNLAQWIEEDIGPTLSGETRENMDLLRGRVVRMEALINGVLEFSRAGRAAKIEQVDLRQLAQEVVELLSPPPDVAIVVSPDLPRLWTERFPLQQVLLNLLSNALKYGRNPVGGSRIEIAAEQQGTVWEISVCDNGPGIAPEFHSRIWGIFQRLEARDRMEGTGIGLAIVKKIVEGRGGQAWVDSAVGRGAAFRFRWPARTERALERSL